MSLSDPSGTDLSLVFSFSFSFFTDQWTIFILKAWFTIFRFQGPLNPYIFWKLMMSAIQIRAKYKHKDNVSYKDKDAKGINELITVCYTFGILTTQAFKKRQIKNNNKQQTSNIKQQTIINKIQQSTTKNNQQQTTNNNKWQTMTNNKQRPTTNNNQPQTLTNDK